jgi:uncharacterized protein (TIGR03437 family)
MTNFYFYRRMADDRGLFLVWDKDQTFANPEWSIWQNTAQNVLLRRALQVPELKKRYFETLGAAARSAGGANGWLEGERKRIYEQIRRAAMEDPVRVCVPANEIDYCPWPLFDQAVEWVGEFTRNRGAFVETELRLAGFELPARSLLPGSACNAASAAPVLAPGALIQITTPLNLSTVTSAATVPLPLELNGVSVTIGDRPAPIARVSPLGALVQVPWEAFCGPSYVRILDNGVQGNAIPADIRPAVSGIFTVTHADGTVVTSANPGRAGELLVAWVTGLGGAEKPLLTGAAAPIPALRTKATVTARIGGLSAKVDWAGFTPGMVGLEQVLIEAPAGLTGPGPHMLDLTVYEEMGVPYALPFR